MAQYRVTLDFTFTTPEDLNPFEERERKQLLTALESKLSVGADVLSVEFVTAQRLSGRGPRPKQGG